MEKSNIFQIEHQIANPKKEIFEDLFKSKKLKIERIVSTGQTTPENEWYDQETDEWVILLEGEAKILFENDEVIELSKGDFIHIPAHKKHRVVYTRTNPPCIWLAAHWHENKK